MDSHRSDDEFNIDVMCEGENIAGHSDDDDGLLPPTEDTRGQDDDNGEARALQRLSVSRTHMRSEDMESL